MSRSSKWLLGGVAALMLVVLLFVAAGPWLAMNGIRNVVTSGDYGQLWRFVDFDRLRQSVRPQLQERIATGIMGRMGPGGTSEALGGVGALIAGPAIDAMVSPAGFVALLHGSALARRASGERPPDGTAGRADPLEGATTRYESPSLFTATITDPQGRPVVLEFHRSGLTWKLAGIRLPD